MGNTTSIDADIVADLVAKIMELGIVADHVPTRTEDVRGLIKLEDQTLIDPDQLAVLHRLGIAPTVYVNDDTYYVDPNDVVKVVRRLIDMQLKFACTSLGYKHVKDVLVAAVHANTIQEGDLPAYLDAVQSTLVAITDSNDSNDSNNDDKEQA